MNKKLTDMEYSLVGNNKAYAELLNAGMIDYDQLDTLFSEYANVSPDFFDIAGNMINQFMLSHPNLKSGWDSMTADERWIFVTAIHNGIEGSIQKALEADRE